MKLLHYLTLIPVHPCSHYVVHSGPVKCAPPRSAENNRSRDNAPDGESWERGYHYLTKRYTILMLDATQVCQYGRLFSATYSFYAGMHCCHLVPVFIWHHVHVLEDQHLMHAAQVVVKSGKGVETTMYGGKEAMEDLWGVQTT